MSPARNTSPVHTPHVRLGGRAYRVADGYEDTFGVKAFRRVWRSLFAERQAVSGDPGVQNVRTEDLRWRSTSFAGGEGQAFTRIGDEVSERRYLRSVGLDLTDTGELRLGRSMFQVSGTGGAVTTVEGNAAGWSGGSVYGATSDYMSAGSGTTLLSPDISIAANTTRTIEAYAYLEPFAMRYEDDEFSGDGVFVGSHTGEDWIINSGGLRQTATFAPVLFQQRAEITVTLESGLPDPTQPHVFEVWEYTSADAFMGVKAFTTFVPSGSPQTISLTWNATSGRRYRYVISHSDSGGPIRVSSTTEPNWGAENFVRIVDLATHFSEWLVRRTSDNAIVANGIFTNTDTRTSTRVIQTQVSNTTGGPLNYRLEFTDRGPSMNLIVDRIEHSPVTLDDPRVVTLGYNDRIWLADRSASGQPSLFYYDEATAQWVAAGVFGVSGETPVALAHSGSYQYVLGSGGQVWRSTGTAPTAWTADLGGTMAGLAVSGNRIYLLELLTGVVRLYEYPLTGTAPVAGTAVYTLPAIDNAALDQTIPQPMAATAQGVVFFENLQGACTVHAYNAGTQTGAEVVKMPTGFKGTAIAHGNGLTFLAGVLAARDATGTSYSQPAIYVIDHLSGQTTIEQLNVRPMRDEDPGSTVRAMQFYNTDLFIQTDVPADPDVVGDLRKMRVWRLSLAEPGGLFLRHEQSTTTTAQQSEIARGLAVNHQTIIAIWGSGSPWIEGDDYIIVGGSEVPHIVTSRTNFGLTEAKTLLALDVNAEIPTGTEVRIYCGLDDRDEDDWTLCGVWTEQGAKPISTPGETHTFRYLQLKIELVSTDSDLTPTVYAVDVQAVTNEYEKSWELLLLCVNETGSQHVAGRQYPGGELVDFIFESATTGAVVLFEDFYGHDRVEDVEQHYVTIESPNAHYVGPGEAIVQVRLTERGTG